MKWIHIKKELLGQPLYATPNYEEGSQRSVVEYLYGITELDNTLAETGEVFPAKNMELQMLLYPDLLMFMLVQGTEAREHFTIERDKVVKINTRHHQALSIRKDTVPEPSVSASKMVSAYNKIVAAITKLVKGKRKTKPVQGSLFEIVLESTINGENEKIVIACTYKNREVVDMFCSKIIP